jgi:hypothetical protein
MLPSALKEQQSIWLPEGGTAGTCAGAPLAAGQGKMNKLGENIYRPECVDTTRFDSTKFIAYQNMRDQQYI